MGGWFLVMYFSFLFFIFLGRMVRCLSGGELIVMVTGTGLARGTFCGVLVVGLVIAYVDLD